MSSAPPPVDPVGSARPEVVWIGPLPPPVHGASLITARFLERVRAQVGTGKVRVVDVGGRGSGPRFHLSRLVAHVRAAVAVTRLPADGTVYVSLAGKLGLWYQLPILVLARLLDRRLVLHHHSYTYVATRWCIMAVIGRLLRRTDDHLFLSATMSEAYCRLYVTAARSTVISNAHFVDPPRRARPPVPEGPVRLVHVSNLSTAKGTVVAIRTCELLRRRDPAVRLTLVGPCHEPETLAAIEAAGDAVRWVGPQPTEGVYAELDAADVFLFPTSYPNEAEPLVVLEALSRGVPVVATARGALPDLLPADWLVDPGDSADRAETACPIAAVAMQLHWLTAQPGWRTSTAERARQAFSGLRGDVDPVATVLADRSARREDARVLQVLPSFDPGFGGPVSAALGVTESYVGVRGVTLTTIGCGEPGTAWDAFRTRAFRSRRSPVGPPHVLSFSAPLLRWTRAHLREFDVLHLHYNRSLTLIWLPWLARRAGVPYVIQTHGMCTPWRGPLALVDRAFTFPALRHARGICVLGPAERDEMRTIAPDAAIVVMHNAVSSPVPAPRRPLEQGPRLLFCARLHPRKGLMTFLEVVERLAPRHPGLEGHVVGQDEGALEEARARARARGLPVVFHGGLERDQVDRWMSSCDVLLHPAPREPFGMSMLEAFAADLPVIASASSELAALFLREAAALLPVDGAFDEWAGAVELVLTDAGVRRQLTEGGHRVLEHHFSRASLTRTLTEVVALSGAGPSGPAW